MDKMQRKIHPLSKYETYIGSVLKGRTQEYFHGPMDQMVSRRLIAKTILRVVKPDVLEAAGCLQLCASQRGDCEAAIHAMREIFLEQYQCLTSVGSLSQC